MSVAQGLWMILTVGISHPEIQRRLCKNHPQPVKVLSEMLDLLPTCIAFSSASL